MKNAVAARAPIAEPIYETRQPFDLSDKLRATVELLDLVDAVEQAKNQGSGILYETAPIEFHNRLREAIVRVTTAGEKNAGGSNMLLIEDPIFEEVVQWRSYRERS